jgi:hypothetical protein
MLFSRRALIQHEPRWFAQFDDNHSKCARAPLAQSVVSERLRQAAQALVYVPQAAPTQSAGTENLQPLGMAGSAAHLTLAAPGSTRVTTVSLFDQGLTQVLQAAVSGLEPAKPYALALTSNADGTGEIEPIAQFMTNPAGAAVVNAVGPIRQIVDPAMRTGDKRRFLTVMTLQNGKPGRPVQLQRPEIR